jgi:hypothetical protein
MTAFFISGGSMNIFFEKPEEQKITSQRELVEHLLNNSGDVDEMSEENRREMDARIMAKLKSGKKLSQKELDYLRRTNPILYAQAMRVQRMAEALEEQLKHARSKEEVNQIFTTALSGISKNDPDREYLVASFNRISTEFRKSKMYNKLPTTIEEVKKKKKQIDPDKDLFKEDNDDKDGFDLSSWSPLRELYDQMPSFVAGA